jgi:hypothetical protein
MLLLQLSEVLLLCGAALSMLGIMLITIIGEV